MHVQEPVVPLPVAAQPVQSYRQHLLAGFVPVAAHVVALVKPGVKPPGGVPLGEGAHRGGVHPRLAEDVVEAVVVHNVGEIPWAACQPAVSGGAAVAHRPVVDAEHPADQRGPGGQAGCVRAVVLVKADALPADLVHVGGGVAAVAVAAHVVRPQGVDVYKQNPHIFRSSP